MGAPLFFVVARVVSRDGALEKVCLLALRASPDAGPVCGRRDYLLNICFLIVSGERGWQVFAKCPRRNRTPIHITGDMTLTAHRIRSGASKDTTTPSDFS